MSDRPTGAHPALLIWPVVILAAITPVIAAGFSPLLAWRDPVYVIAGFAGIIAMALMLFQPLLVIGFLPGLPVARGRRIHRFTGALLVVCVLLHVVGLWLTSPPDVIDALLLVSPTPFSIWGVFAMWAVFAAALFAVFRKNMKLRAWRVGHTLLVSVTVIGTVVHVLLIEGTMEVVSKLGLSLLLLAAVARAVFSLRAWAPRGGGSKQKRHP